MRSIRPPFSRARRVSVAATGLIAALALTATGCGSGDDTSAADKPSAGASDGSQDGGKVELPGDLKDKLKDHGIDADKWAAGGWKDWSKDKWLREAKDFVNPVIKDLWQPERMRTAKDPGTTVSAKSSYSDGGAGESAPQRIRAKREKTPYHENAAPVGKIFFDSPEGSMVCSGTVVKDSRNPGKSNLVWTAGHCVHAGAEGGWYRNIAFVPSYNDYGKQGAALRNATRQEIQPYGQYWADWVATSNEWIEGGSSSGSDAFAYDYAVMHVQPEQGGKSLEETVGNALTVDFSVPSPREAGVLGAWGYPAAPPYDGDIMHKCIDNRPGNISIGASLPPMYRIGCTMTGGSSGGGWFRNVNGKAQLVSNTSMGPADNTWLAGPQLGRGAKNVYDLMSEKYGSR